MDLSILVPSMRSVELLNEWLRSKGCPQYAEIFKEQGEKWGVRWDICIFQACLETGFWRFGGDVKVEQNNFFGTGASGNGAPGDSFPTPAMGIAAHMQNMALRAGVKIPKEAIISPYVEKNYDLISNRNTTMWSQLAGTYAADVKYWEKIQAIIDKFDRWAAGKDTPVPPIPVPLKKIVNLDVGHSLNNPGARSRAGADEYKLNKLQYQIIKDIVEAKNILTKCYDPATDNLTAVGEFAKGCNMSVHIHHNAYSGDSDPGTEVLYDNDKADAISIMFAKKVSAAIAKALGTKDRGARPFAGTVMDVAERQGDFPVILTESYFLNPYNQAEAEKRSIIAAKAIAQCIIEYFS